MIPKYTFLLIKNAILIILVVVCQFSVFSQKSSEVKKKPRIGLVLSGGGARGFAHIGVIKVLEEEGIDVDIIGGTSMGSIVGGLYAMGYSIDAIEEIALSQDWDYILNDKRNRRDLGFYEKFSDEVHIFSLAIKNRKVSIPPGLVYGQNTTNLLAKLTSPVYQTHKFEDLNKPFFCMATDLLSGKAIKMDTGNLAIAIRASMSVPSAFVPVEYGPYYLVDGGLMNNFPAKEVKELGADFLIGIDIQTPLLEQEEIDNLIQVLSQSLFFYAEDVFNENLAMIDLLIKPEIDPFTAMDFDRADSLILRGEKKAREMIPQIRAFMDSIGLEPQESARRDYNLFPDMDMIYVDKVIFHGNDKVTDDYLLKKMDIHSGDQISVVELNDKITHLYGTKLFHTINYSLEYSSEGETIIIVEIQEATLFDVNVGAHYNDYAKAGLLLNLTGRNFGARNGRLSLDLALGKVNRFTASYIVDNGLNPGFGGDINLFNQSGYLYDENGKKVLSFDMAVYRHHGYGLLTMNNISSFRIGYELEANTIKQGISIIDFDKLGNFAAGVFSDFVIDTYDRLYMPNKGVRFLARFDLGTGENTKIIIDEKGNTDNKVVDFTYSAITIDMSGVVPIGDHFIIKPDFYFRRTFGSEIPLTKTSFFGGFSQTYIANYRPFPGYEFMEIEAQMVYNTRIRIRHNFWENHYISLLGNVLSVDLNFDESLDENEFYYGWQLAYTYYSLIGPISISMAEAYPKGKMVYDFSLGFWF